MSTSKSRKFLFWGIILLLNKGAFSQPANLYTFPGPDVDLGVIDGGTNSSGQHFIGGRGDTVYVVRQFGGSVYCHKSTDGGQGFSLGVQVNSTFSGVNPSLKVDTAGVVYVAYQAFADIYFSKSSDGGQTFTVGVKVNDDTIPQTGQEKPALGVNNKGQIYVAWRDQRNSAPHTHQTVFAAASYDGGLSFMPNVQINDSTSPMGGGIDIGADNNGHVYVVWAPYQGSLMLSRSDDSGGAFPVRTPISGFAFSPSLAVGAGGAIGVSYEHISGTLRFSVSRDSGQTFSPSIIVDSSGGPQSPSLMWKHGIFYVAWRANHRRTSSGPDLNHIWFSYSRDSGKTFVPYVDAVPDDIYYVPHDFPSIWVSETEKACVVWADSRWDPNFDEIWDLFVSVGKPTLIKGDLNFDGIVTGRDIVLELNAVFFGQSFQAPFATADGNCDGKLTAVDMILLLNWWYLGIPLPCN